MGGQGVEKGLGLAMIYNLLEPMDVMSASSSMSCQSMRSQSSHMNKMCNC